jgi:hypothetical protein
MPKIVDTTGININTASLGLPPASLILGMTENHRQKTQYAIKRKRWISKREEFPECCAYIFNIPMGREMTIPIIRLRKKYSPLPIFTGKRKFIVPELNRLYEDAFLGIFSISERPASL